MVAGLIGAIWFLILDALAGRPLYTPTVLAWPAVLGANLLAAQLKAVDYVWGGARRGGRRHVLSDHAALLVDLADA